LRDAATRITKACNGVAFGSYVFSAGTAASSYALYFTGDLASFAWNPAILAYERTRTNFTVTLPNRTVLVSSVFVQIRFYTSTDAGGSSYQPNGNNITSGWDSAVHSLTYSRTISGSTTNCSTGTVSAFSAASNLVFTNINTVAHSVTVNGTHSDTFTRTFTNGRIVEGTFTDTITSLVITYNPATVTFSWAGSPRASSSGPP
jgi:hypothetical protein